MDKPVLDLIPFNKSKTQIIYPDALSCIFSEKKLNNTLIPQELGDFQSSSRADQELVELNAALLF